MVVEVGRDMSNWWEILFEFRMLHGIVLIQQYLVR
jgi:hypothetical protein